MSHALRIISIFMALIAVSRLVPAGEASPASFFIAQGYETEPTLVYVDFITEIPGARDFIEINGKRIADYSPVIIQVFSSTGIVLDNKSHIMTFLGYRWVDIHDQDLRIEVTAGEGRKFNGKLIGIDQSSGVSVVRLLGGRLNATPVCKDCEAKDGATLMAPVIGRGAPALFQEAQILSVGTAQGFPGQTGWTIKMNRPFPDIGLPVLTADRRVLGFVAGQDPSGLRSVVYPISQLLSSAQKILQKGGDIRTGWLGVYLADAQPAKGRGIELQRVEPNSPAQRAGLMSGDCLLKYNGQEIMDARQFIHLVQNTPIGSKAVLEILRQGNPMTLNSLIEARRPQPIQPRLTLNFPDIFGLKHAPVIAGEGAGAGNLDPQPIVGLDTVFLTPPLADALRLPGKTGLLVIEVARRLPADRAGVLAGDVIVAMDGQSILDPLSLADYLQNRDWEKQLELKILRKGVERTITIRLSDQNR